MKRTINSDNMNRYKKIIELANATKQDVVAVSKVVADDVSGNDKEKASCRIYLTDVGMMSNANAITAICNAISLADRVWFSSYKDEHGRQAVIVTLWVRNLLSDDDEDSERRIKAAVDKVFATPDLDAFIDTLDWGDE